MYRRLPGLGCIHMDEALAKLREDIALLATPYVPDAQDTSVIKARLQAQGSEIGALAKRINSLGKELDELRAMRTILVQHYAVGEALLAPIRRLPVELLEEVIANSLPVFCLTELENDNSDTPLHPDDPHPHVARAELKRVCRRWKIVIENAPRLWSTISLDYTLPEDNGAIASMLAKSGTCPLDIFIQPESWFAGYDEGRQCAVFGLLRASLPRMRVFVAHLDDECDMFDIFPRSELSEAPRLEVFGHVRHDDPGPEEDEERWTGRIRSPKLRSLLLRNAEFQVSYFTPLPELRRLTNSVENAASSEYLSFLGGCTRLEYLHWTDYGSWEVGRNPAEINLPSLKRLVYYTEEAEKSHEFLGNIRANALESLVVDASIASCGTPPIQEMLESFIRTETASLLRLDIWHASFKGGGVALILSRLTNIQIIRLVSCELDAAFFTALAGGACPNLVSLVFDWAFLPVDKLVHFVHERVRSDVEERNCPGRIGSVIVSHCKDPGAEDMQQQLLQLKQTHSEAVEFVF